MKKVITYIMIAYITVIVPECYPVRYTMVCIVPDVSCYYLWCACKIHAASNGKRTQEMKTFEF